MIRNVFNHSVTISIIICVAVPLHIININNEAAIDQGAYK